MELPIVTTIRDLNSPNDQFICARNGVELISMPLYIQGLHVQLPMYSETKWPLVKIALTQIVSIGPELTFEKFVQLYNSYRNLSTEQDYAVLEALIDSGWRGGTVLNILLPQIAQLALQLPKEIREPIKLLRAYKDGSLTLSQRQAAILLANAFYSTFPARDQKRFNRINFNKLFARTTPRAMEKLKCVLHYFAEFMRYEPSGNISIIRQKISGSEKLNWSNMEIPLAELTVIPTGKIEDEGEQMMQLDFANQYIGGGVLGHGCVQEEIRFLISPELIISCLICERMEANEAILMVGAERYSNYDGYDHTFRWLCLPRRPESPTRDHQRRAKSELLAIDALCYPGIKIQFRQKYIHRELMKALAGFSLQTDISPKEIATGNWGCGAFGGDLHLKSMIQLIAASATNRPLYYFTFGGEIFADKLNKIVKLMKERRITIAHLYRMIIEYGKSDCIRPNSLFRWIKERIQIKFDKGSRQDKFESTFIANRDEEEFDRGNQQESPSKSK